MPASNQASSSTSPPAAGAGKRKRVSRACDQCFLKKDRCDGLHPICSFCTTLNRECTYNRPLRKRGPTQGLRPRLEQRILSLEALLGQILSTMDSPPLSPLGSASKEEKARWRQHWLSHPLAAEIGLSSDLVSSVEPLKKEDQSEEEVEEDSDVDLALPPTHPQQRRKEGEGIAAEVEEPLLSSGKGGSSLNRGLVPRGADPNAALGGFEIEFGGNRADEDWVRRFGVQELQELPEEV